MANNKTKKPESELVTVTQGEVTEDGSLELSEQWLELAKSGQHTAVETVRQFVSTVDSVIPMHDNRVEIINAALDMAQRLAMAPFDTARSVIGSTVSVNVDVDVDVLTKNDVDVGVNVLSRK